jgi:hypothetical protein
LLLSVLYSVVRLLIDLVVLRSGGARARDVELLALRHEVRVLRRQQARTAWRPGDRFVFAALSRRLPRAGWTVLPVRPETLLRWHRELVRRRWTLAAQRRRPGRPPLTAACRDLVRRLATEHPSRGYRRIRGEPLTLGCDSSAATIRSILRRQGLPPAPRRAGLSWRAVRRAHAGAVLTCDFLAVETVRRQNPVRAPLHRGPDPARVLRRVHRAPDRRMGQAAGP